MKLELSCPVLRPGLYLVATPIGNLKDITLRALEVLSAVDIIYCEDTRQSQKLLKAYGISTKTAAYHDHSSDSVRRKILQQITDEDKTIALISDAGMPLISDPGYKLVRAAHEDAAYVTSVPGANALLTALQLSGLPSEQFLFLGFLPSKDKARKEALAEWQSSPATLIFYEAKQRVVDTLQALCEVMPTRRVAVTRELTKAFEEIICLPVEEALANFNAREAIKGEFVILVAPAEQSQMTRAQMTAQIQVALSQGTPVKVLSEDLAQVSGWTKKDIYSLALEIK